MFIQDILCATPVATNTGWFPAAFMAKTKEDLFGTPSTDGWPTKYHQLPKVTIISPVHPPIPSNLSIGWILESKEAVCRDLVGESLWTEMSETGDRAHDQMSGGALVRKSQRVSMQWLALHLLTTLLKVPASKSNRQGFLSNWEIATYLKPTIIRMRQIVQTLWVDDTIIIMALWYIHRLYPVGFSISSFPKSTPNDMAATIGRLFALGIILAEKWHSVDMYRYSLSKFEVIFNWPTKSIRDAEKAALQCLDWNLTLTQSDWMVWIERLQNRSKNFFDRHKGFFDKFTDQRTMETMDDLRGVRQAMVPTKI